jgi:PAS domain S-box-containing protein
MAQTKILVVEDEPIIARDIAEILRSFGYQVTAIASSGEEAVKKVVEQQPDLVLMDIVLKGSMDGIETTACIQARCDIPFVYLSAYSDREVLKRARETYPYGYLIKPVTEHELAMAIERALFNHETNQWINGHEPWAAGALHGIRDGVITTDQQGDVMFMNPMAERLTGWLQVDALGKNLAQVLELFHKESQAPFADAVRQALQAGREVVQLGDLINLRAKDGREHQITGSMASIRDEQGTCVGAAVIFREFKGGKK